MTDEIVMVNWNIRGLTKQKVEVVEELLERADIVILIETWSPKVLIPGSIQYDANAPKAESV